MKKLFIPFFFLFCSITAIYGQTIPYSIGRIVISSDGNEHDHDDWAATPFSLALIASQGLQDKLTVYTFSDHIWGSNQDWPQAQKEMQISALEGKKQFGFKKTKFIEAVKHPEKAYEAMKKEINKSSASDPLTIIAAGPMQVVGEAISRANPEKLKFVRIISHSRWNDMHAQRPKKVVKPQQKKKWTEDHEGWIWKEIEEKFTPMGLTCDHILDQNGGEDYNGMRAKMELFDWINTSEARHHPAYKKGSWDWLYERQKTCIKSRGTEFDPSDAGMLIYLFTGIEKTNPIDAQRLMENPKTNL